MGCPFAMLANVRNFGAKDASSSSHHRYHAAGASPAPAPLPLHTAAEPSSTKQLTVQMKEATWTTHRNLERSKGVAALMGRPLAAGGPRMERIDYVRFLIMLACMYAPMEQRLLSRTHKDALSAVSTELVRTQTLLYDVQAHINTLMSVEEGEEDAQIASLGLGAVDDDGDAVTKAQALQLYSTVKEAQDSLARLGVYSRTRSPCHITYDHVAILSGKQIKAVLAYVERLEPQSIALGSSSLSMTGLPRDEGISFTPTEATTPTSPPLTLPLSKPGQGAQSTGEGAVDPIIAAHAYVRYMGDLSGGQHMAKRLSKLFPIYDAQTPDCGFEFYTFQEPNALKERLRQAIDALSLDEASVQLSVEEAVHLFDLHHALFASLVDEDDEEKNTASSDPQSPPSLVPFATAAASSVPALTSSA